MQANSFPPQLLNVILIFVYHLPCHMTYGNQWCFKSLATDLTQNVAVNQ